MITEKNFHILYRLGKRTRPFFKKNQRFYSHYSIKQKSDRVNNLIYSLLRSEKPLMISRFGSVESELIVNFLEQEKEYNDFNAVYKYLIGDLGLYWKDSPKYFKNLCLQAGFFPNEPNLTKNFINIYLESSKNIDILGVWNELEEFIPTLSKDITLCNIRELEPWFYEKSWSKALEDKNVLVIHPFEETIKSQYNNRFNIYKNENVLPNFNLKTIKAVQTIADEKSEFNNWFEALDYMKNQIDKIDFDIAILGCGAYGLPLASYIKDKGKQAIHLGGVTQLLFGIKGKRWENWNHYTDLRKGGWVYTDERPKGFDKVEGGCYW